MKYDSLNLENEVEVSVVIPTLGGASLKHTIERLNSGYLIPKEILVCIPEAHSYKVVDYHFENVKIVKTPFCGQVRQRAFGFSLVKYPFVLQLDDDLELDKACLVNLVKFLNSNPDCSVSPSLLDKASGKMSSHLSKPSSSSGFLYRILFWVINGNLGYLPGKISKAGVNIGFSNTIGEPYEVEWLPGGCALHFKKHLITYDYYPYVGKAYAEDLLQSFLLKKNGIKLYHHPGATSSLDNSSSKSNGIKSLFKIFFSYSRIMFFFAKKTGSNRIRLFFFLIIHHVILIYRKFIR